MTDLLAQSLPLADASAPRPDRLPGEPSNVRAAVVTIIFLAMLAILAWLDVLTGPGHVHLGLLYILPVLLASWFGNRGSSYTLGLSAATVWFLAGRPVSDGTAFFVNAVNLGIRIFFYLLVCEVVGRLRSAERYLENAVTERTLELRLEITERQRAESALRKLAAQLSAAEDEERRRIAYDIHDALSQMLGVVKLNLETVVAETAIDTRQFAQLTDLVQVIDDLIHQTREMTFDLHPSMLDHFGLVPTLQQFGQDFQRRTKAEVTIKESGDRISLTNSLASYLFRAIKELINNAVKHGNAREIIVAIYWVNQQMRTVIDDDGIGFDPVKALAPQKRRGLGLAGIDERLTSLGGSMRIESQLGSGTRVILELPVASEIG